MALSKKKEKEINFLFVADDVLREHFTTSNGRARQCFLDDSPENWNKDETEIYDLAQDIERRLKERIINILAA